MTFEHPYSIAFNWYSRNLNITLWKYNYKKRIVHGAPKKIKDNKMAHLLLFDRWVAGRK